MPSTKENSTLKYCIILPTYNNEKTLKEVLDNVLQISRNVIVVNDGSTDNTHEILSSFTDVHIIQYPINKGKGHALKLGFRQAIADGYDYAITIDSDGQHYPDDIPRLVAKVHQSPGNVVMGCRNMDQKDIPGKSSFGNKFSNFWFWTETGIKLSDTQTGFRAYPLKSIRGMQFFTKKFEFEIEVIVRLAWENVKFAEVPIKVEYPEDRVSHFRPTTDFARISVLNTVLVILAFLFFLPRLLIQNFSLKRKWHHLKQEFIKDLRHPYKLSLAIGTGLFYGILPIWGFQMMAAFATASYFKLNRVLVLIISNISIPPMVPLIIFASFKFGGLFVSNPVYLRDIDTIDKSSIYIHFIQYLYGAVLLSITMALTGFLITWIVTTIAKYAWRLRREN